MSKRKQEKPRNEVMGLFDGHLDRRDFIKTSAFLGGSLAAS
jgi:hypothetical protein